MPKNNRNEQGFTLVELAIVMMIGGIIMAMMFNLISVALNNMTERENASKFKFVQAEVNRFLETHGRFPCPASLTKAVDTADFGREILTDCRDNTAVAGTFTTTGRLGVGIRIGALPVRTLNLPDEYIYDAYDSRFLYAITVDMANANSYSHDIGAIYIEDTNGNSTITPAGSAPYVILSAGKNQSGGYTSLSGVAIDSTCAATNPSDNEKENCDNDGVFISAYLSSAEGSNYFDDKLVTYAGSANKGSIPAGGVMFFDLAKCPQGWQIFYGTAPLDGMKPCKKI